MSSSFEPRDLLPSSQLIHGGPSRDPHTGASSLPVHHGSTFHQEDPLHLGQWDYSRSGNPTRAALEATLATLEGAHRAFAFASGMAAISSFLLTLKPGDHVVASEDVYGGTYRVLSGLFARWGLRTTWVQGSDLASYAAAIEPDTRILWVETPSNPLLRIVDLRAMATLAHQRGILAVTDGTFQSPWLQRPLELGFDVVIHSATKLLSGHSDVLAGVVAVNSPELAQKVYYTQNAFGAVLGPQDCWLLLRGLRTLGVRMNQQQATAQLLAERLLAHPAVQAVHYPGLPHHPGAAIHAAQTKGPGAVLSFELADASAAQKLLQAVKLPLVGVSLGGVETILSYPATMSHAAMPRPERLQRGITDGLIRLSAGLEDPEDLWRDLLQGLAST